MPSKSKKETAKKAAPAKASKSAPLKASAAKSAPVKAIAKSTKKAEPKIKLAVVASKKGDKKSEKLEIKATELLAAAPTEEEEEELEASSASSANASNAGLAMAAASAETAQGSLKNFRHHPDIENFYRFIFENDLRYEALEIIDAMALQREHLKTVKAAKARPN